MKRSLFWLMTFVFPVLGFANSLVRIDGSSTVFPITEAVAEEFQVSQKGKVKVTVGISGTGGGFKKFCRGETDVQNASRPITASEMKVCADAKITYIELPVAFDAMVVVVNTKNDWVSEISVDDLKKIWEPAAQGKILTWDQVNAKWPKEKLKLYGAGSDSGTFDYFTEAVVGKAKSSRGDYTASEDDNTLVQGVATDKFALGYMPLSYYEENKSKLKALAIVGGPNAPKKNQGVLPSRQTVENGDYFPLSRPLFLYVSANALLKPEVKDFANFYVQNASTLIPEVNYIPLPQKAYEVASTRLTKSVVGTVFGGHAEIGLKIEDILHKETKL